MFGPFYTWDKKRLLKPSFWNKDIKKIKFKYISIPFYIPKSTW